MSARDPVEDFVAAVLVPIRNTDRIKYPLTPGQVKRYYLDLAAAEFLAARETLQSRGWSVARIAGTFHNPSRVMRMSYYVLEGSRMLGHGVEHQRALLAFLVDLVGALKHSDPLGADGLNLQRPSDVARAEAMKRGLAPVDGATSRRIHRLAAALRTYMDAVYLVPHDVGMEMYGPYTHADGHHMVRAFFNLRPVWLWPETACIPAERVVIDTDYTSNIQIRFDPFNNPYVEGGSYITACRAAGVEVDGEVATPAQIDALTTGIMGVVKEVVSQMAALPEVDRAAIYIRSFWARMGGMLVAAGRSTEPPDAVFERLRDAPILPDAGPAPDRVSLLANLGL